MVGRDWAFGLLAALLAPSPVALASEGAAQDVPQAPPTPAEGTRFGSLLDSLRESNPTFAIKIELDAMLTDFTVPGCDPAEASTCTLRAIPLPPGARCNTPLVVDHLLLLRDRPNDQGALLVLEVTDAERKQADGGMKPVHLSDQVHFVGAIMAAPFPTEVCTEGVIDTPSFVITYGLRTSPSPGTADPDYIPLPDLGILNLFQSADRSFFSGAVCLLTGCEEHRSLRVTIRGGDERLPILQDGEPTARYTDQTFVMPIRLIDRLAVLMPGGSPRPISECRIRRNSSNSEQIHDCTDRRPRRTP